MRVERLCAAAAFVLCMCAPDARAGGQVSVGDVLVTVRTPWPDMLDHGAQPLLFDVENAAHAPRTVDLMLMDPFVAPSARIVKELVLEAGARESFELFAPVSAYEASAYQLQVTVNGQRDSLSGLGATKPPVPGVRQVLVMSSKLGDPGAASYWSSDLSREAAPRWTAPPIASGPYGRAMRLSALGYGRPGAPSPPSAVVATFVPIAELPARSEPYSSIDAVVLDPIDGPPPAEQWAAITSYARSGGVLALFGRGAVRIARASADLAPWLEKRFRVDDTGHVDTYLCGQGLLLVCDTNAPLDSPFQISALNAAMEQHGQHMGWVPSPRGGRGATLAVKLPGLELPIRTMAIVLILFSLLIGPINMHFVKRARKPALLLVTVPVIALVFSGVLFAWGALAQGLDVRAQRQTFTLLDQRAHRSTSAEVRQIFAGLSHGALRPGPGGSLWPELGVEWQDKSQYLIDATSGIALGGEYMPVRTPVRQTLLTDRASRVRVDVSRDGEGYAVKNALGATIEVFAYRAADGRVWSAKRLIADGASAPLELGGGDELHDGIDRVLGAPIGAEHLPTGAYAARVSTCDFVDHMGIDARDVGSQHVLVGILDAAEAP